VSKRNPNLTKHIYLNKEDKQCTSDIWGICFCLISWLVVLIDASLSIIDYITKKLQLKTLYDIQPQHIPRNYRKFLGIVFSVVCAYVMNLSVASSATQYSHHGS
jgi:hypothetical protein